MQTITIEVGDDVAENINKLALDSRRLGAIVRRGVAVLARASDPVVIAQARYLRAEKAEKIAAERKAQEAAKIAAAGAPLPAAKKKKAAAA